MRHLQNKYAIKSPRKLPSTTFENKVLLTSDEWKQSVRSVQNLGLPPHGDDPKNWDSLAALNCILQRTNRNANILDAGAELYSMILNWLFLYGYRNLFGVNLVFEKPIKRGSIRYSYADITASHFEDCTFDAITSLSVIEHGVDLDLYFKEMSRILKLNGILITSTDYFDVPPNTRDKNAYGGPVHIFSKEDVNRALELAGNHGFRLTSLLDLNCDKKAVRWDRLDLEFTYIFFTLEKMA